MNTPIVLADKLKKTTKKLTLKADAIRRLGADPAQKKLGAPATFIHCGTSGTTNICC